MSRTENPAPHECPACGRPSFNSFSWVCCTSVLCAHADLKTAVLYDKYKREQALLAVKDEEGPTLPTSNYNFWK